MEGSTGVPKMETSLVSRSMETKSVEGQPLQHRSYLSAERTSKGSFTLGAPGGPEGRYRSHEKSDSRKGREVTLQVRVKLFPRYRSRNTPHLSHFVEEITSRRVSKIT